MGDFFSGVWDVLGSGTAYESAVRLATVLMFAAVGEWVAEKAGTLNISVEAMMLAGAFTAAVSYDANSNVAVGLAFALIAGLAVALVQAEMSHRLTADPFVVGLTLNILVLGLVGFLDSEWDPNSRLADVIEIPLLSDIPLVGQALFGQRWPFYLIVVAVPLAWWLVYRTRWGLEVRAVGENPQSADVSGIHVNRRRRQAIMVCGLYSGLAGGYLLLGQIGEFEDSNVGGRGFIAIAAVIFGGWTLRGTVGGCLLFGTVASFRFSPALDKYNLNTELLAVAPYLVTVIAMAMFAKRVRQPSALARPFIRGLK